MTENQLQNPLDVLTGGAPKRLARPPSTARVVRSDSSGVWCVPIGEDSDTRHPIGPCRGATRRVFHGTDGAGHRHDTVEQLPVGMVVLLTLTSERPWVAAWEEGM